MAQLNEMADSLSRLPHQVTIEHLKHEKDGLKRKVDQLILENNQIKLDANLVKQDNDRRFKLLNGEMNFMKSRILNYFLQTATSEHANKRICLNETEQIATLYSQVNVGAVLEANKSSFVSIPDDAIRLILIRLPLRHRVLLRIICHRWKSIIESMCRSVRLLKLFGPTIRHLKYDKEEDKYRHSLLLIDMKREVQSPKYPKGITQIQFIPQLFCNVDQVELSFPETFEMTVMQLLESWADRLTNLTLNIKVMDQFLGAAIWHRITQMPKLESFLLLKNLMFDFNTSNNQLTFLEQLREFKFYQYVNNGDEIIQFIGPNIRRLRMASYARDVFSQIQNRPTVVANVTHLTLSIIKTTLEQQQNMLLFICCHFVSLIDLKFGCLDMVPLDEQLTQLSQLPHLTKLSLFLNRDNLDHDLPRAIKFVSLQSLALVTWMKPFAPNQTNLVPNNINELSRIKTFLNEIPTMFPVLVELKIFARNASNVKILEELVNDLVLKSSDRIKYELIEFKAQQ